MSRQITRGVCGCTTSSWSTRVPLPPTLLPARSGPPQALRDEPGPLPDLLRQFDDDALRAAYIAEPEDVLIALQLADKLRPAGFQTGHGGVDVLDDECDVADARCVGRRRRTVTLGQRRVE